MLDTRVIFFHSIYLKLPIQKKGIMRKKLSALLFSLLFSTCFLNVSHAHCASSMCGGINPSHCCDKGKSCKAGFCKSKCVGKNLACGGVNPSHCCDSHYSCAGGFCKKCVKTLNSCDKTTGAKCCNKDETCNNRSGDGADYRCS